MVLVGRIVKALRNCIRKGKKKEGFSNVSVKHTCRKYVFIKKSTVIAFSVEEYIWSQETVWRFL